MSQPLCVPGIDLVALQQVVAFERFPIELPAVEDVKQYGLEEGEQGEISLYSYAKGIAYLGENEGVLCKWHGQVVNVTR